MKNITQLLLAVLPWLLFLLTPEGFCYQAVHCQWGDYGAWSECDPCTKLQTRSRPMAVYSQFGGNRCDGEPTETRPCVTTKGCPLQEGCGDRFRCASGKCISKSLLCNGDQDCEEDALDEGEVCGVRKYIVCHITIPPPGIELLGLGFDAVTEKWRAGVINTKSFGGQCRTIFSGAHSTVYRLPLSTIRYNFLTKVQNDFSSDSYSSSWKYAKDTIKKATVSGTTTGFRNSERNEIITWSENSQLLILKNNIEVAQFQNNAPQYLPISEEFWKALAKLPSVYDYAAYRKLLERFGTHYMSEGSLGGNLEIMVKFDMQSQSRFVSESFSYKECEKTKRWILFIPITHEKCDEDEDSKILVNDPRYHGDRAPQQKVNLNGGDIQYTFALQNMQVGDSDRNKELYSNWADSVRSFPKVTEKKLRPLSELVKEVPCAGLKKLYLRRAIEQYFSESDPCHCRPCSNNGLAVMDGNECKCICKPNTSGPACESGTEVEGQPGVIHGRWTCWSSWSSCSGTRRSRSRYCSNPAPQNGGQHCIGESTETSECEDQELEHLKTMEPQCFDYTLPPSQKCGTPPALINGYILDPKDIYLVGSKVEYSCTSGFHLVGYSTIQCTDAQTWSASPGLCTTSTCQLGSLADGVKATPVQNAYGIGEAVTLSCPLGRQLQGEATIICDPSLNFSPDPATIKCSPAVTQQQSLTPLVQCKPWQKSSRGACVCKMPFECGPSLELCAMSPTTQRFSLLNVCKMHVLQCMGKAHTIAADSTCKWPERTTTACTSCRMWETCDDQSNECRCRDSAGCSTPGLNVCVRVGEDAAAASQTMSECEAGLRRCKGEKVSVVSILPCDA